MLPGRTSARQTVFADRSLSLLPSLPPSNPASLFLSLSVVLGRRRGRVTVHACCGGSQGRYSRNKVQIVNPTRSHCSPGGAGSRAVRFKLPMMPRRPQWQPSWPSGRNGHGYRSRCRPGRPLDSECEGPLPRPGTGADGHGTADFSSLAATTDSEVLYCTGSWAGEFPDCGQTLIDFLPANGEEVLHRGNGDSDAAGARTAQPAIGISGRSRHVVSAPFVFFCPELLAAHNFFIAIQGTFFGIISHR
jgi:hypothetical protein